MLEVFTFMSHFVTYQTPNRCNFRLVLDLWWQPFLAETANLADRVILPNRKSSIDKGLHFLIFFGRGMLFATVLSVARVASTGRLPIWQAANGKEARKCRGYRYVNSQVQAGKGKATKYGKPCHIARIGHRR